MGNKVSSVFKRNIFFCSKLQNFLKNEGVVENGQSKETAAFFENQPLGSK